jgi:hypothetical protein
MPSRDVTRREFLTQTLAGTAATVIGAGALSADDAPGAAPAKRRTATDLVPLGKTGHRICRLGLGTGSNGGKVQRDLGQEGLTRLIRHAYDRGVRFIDTADMYEIHGMVAKAIHGLPREQLWVQTKMRWEPRYIAEGAEKCLDRFLKELDTDYVDSLLIHCATLSTWPEDLKAMMDFFDAAKEKKRLRAKGVSCHGLPALRAATKTDWIDVHLCRVNPQGRHVDGLTGTWSEPGRPDDAFAEIRAMHAKGRGVIGMKIIGNGDFREAPDREKSVRFAMNCGFVDAVVIGCGSPAEVDEAIERINRALEAGA